MYTRNDVKRANYITGLQQYYFWPGTDAVKFYIPNNKIIDCNGKVHDVQTQDNIHGKPYKLMRGKMTRQGPVRHESSIIKKIPAIVSKRYRRVHICVGIYFVNRMVFLHTKSENINYPSVQALTSRKME